jgi:hypothetical protein
VPKATGASFSPPRDADTDIKCDAVTEIGAEVHSMVKSCTAVGEAFMGMVIMSMVIMGMVIMGMVIMGMISRVRVKMFLMMDNYPIVT